jgi:hypothetical protein
MSLAFAASCLVAMPMAFAASTDLPPAATATPNDQMMTPNDQMVTNGPQSDQGDHSRNWSAARNVRESAQYDRLLQSNSRFRMVRMRKECGPINDPQLHESCMASFNQGPETMSGSSTPPQPISNAGGASQ